MLHVGATVIFGRARRVAELFEEIREKAITSMELTPSHLRPILANAADKPGPLIPNVTIAVGSATLYPEEKRATRERLTPRLIEDYATNEAAPLTMAHPRDQERFPDSVGRLVEEIEAEVVDDRDRPLPHGKVGRIRFRGPCFPDGYFMDPEATARHFRGGWFYPGDLASIDAEGYVFLKGRADDTIDHGGVRYYPAEVEAVLLSHPAVAEAAVIGWPDKRLGEVGVAFIVRDAPVDQPSLKAFCRERITEFKVPKHFVFIEAMPKTETGKARKGELKQLLQHHVSRNRSSGRKVPVDAAPP
jgi:acyl-CoA synthetase (AMP-forming)/AMP-acid ligase II